MPGTLVTASVVGLGSAAFYVASVVRRRNRLAFSLPPGSMEGRTAVVTGANSGVGRAVAIELSRAGATTVLACRDVVAGQRVADDIAERHGKAHVLPLELTSFASIRGFAKAFEEHHPTCDLLVLNAGIMRKDFAEVAPGVEHTYPVNSNPPDSPIAEALYRERVGPCLQVLCQLLGPLGAHAAHARPAEGGGRGARRAFARRHRGLAAREESPSAATWRRSRSRQQLWR